MRWRFDRSRGVLVDERNAAMARVTDRHLVTRGEAAAAQKSDAPGAETIVVWSGTMAEMGDGFAADPRNWSAAAWGLLREALTQMLASLSGSQTPSHNKDRILVRTHAGHIVSDIPSCVRFLELAREVNESVSRGGGGASRKTSSAMVRFLVDPLSMLTAEMAASPAAVDHLTRLCDWLAQLSGDGEPLLAGVGVAPADEPDARRAELSKVLEGLLDARGVALPRVELGAAA